MDNTKPIGRKVGIKSHRYGPKRVMVRCNNNIIES